MKKVLFSVMMLLSAGVVSAAKVSENMVDDAKRYDMSVNMQSLSNTLALNQEQRESVEYIHGIFCYDMRRAAKATGAKRAERMEKAILRDLKGMHYVLTEEQYRKYLLLLNVTFNNRGIEVK